MIYNTSARGRNQRALGSEWRGERLPGERPGATQRHPVSRREATPGNPRPGATSRWQAIQAQVEATVAAATADRMREHRLTVGMLDRAEADPVFARALRRAAEGHAYATGTTR